MTANDFGFLAPLLAIGIAPVVIMLAVAVRRSYVLSCGLALGGIVAAFLALFAVPQGMPHRVTSLLIFDNYALLYMGLIFASTFAVTLLASEYLAARKGDLEEFYVLLLLACLGSSLLVVSNHFGAFFIGIEILSISLYALIGYTRNGLSIEAGVKYLVLAAASSGIFLFGIALLYGETGTMEFPLLAARTAAQGTNGLILTAGLALVVAGIGFKLAVAPFHMWTADVYEGAPAPVTAFVATVSKGAVFALLLRFFAIVDINAHHSLFAAVAVIAVLSMFAGNLLALLQNNVKRILAYSSIAHLGYLLVAFLASGAMRVTAVSFYLVAYFITTLGAFGVVTVLSGKERDADDIEDYRGLFTRRPWTALIFSAMLLSLAGIPLTAGFIGKFYVIAAGAGSALWLLVVMLVLNSAIGLYYYLRLMVVMYVSPGEEKVAVTLPLSVTGYLVLAVLVILLVWLGIYPAPVIELIRSMTAGI
ncbi:MAG: NADH-quinone oxidoreductase subunit N [Nitrospirae bacterium]|nr:NADH-quinone oxidoreductase subunit N [Nitrospirota bacterium]